jgi:uncharacterized protein YndB with AHSA1/START domain
VRTRGSVEIAAPPAVVWEAITDPARIRIWQPDLLRVDLIGEDRGAGALFYSEETPGGHRPGGQPVLHVCRVTAWAPPRRYAFEQVLGNFTASLRVEFSIEETPGGCRLALDQEMTLQRRRLLLSFIIRRFQEREMAASLSRLKRAVEARPAGSPGGPGDRIP